MKFRAQLTLFLTLISFGAPAAKAEECNFLRRVVTKVQAVDGVVGNLRKNAFAQVFKPQALKEFDTELFNAEKSRFLQGMGKPEFKVNAVDFENGRFESKLAYLEALAQYGGNETRSFLDALNALPPYQRNRLYRNVKRTLSGKAAFTQAALDNRIQDLYSDILGWHYPHVMDGLSDQVVEETLKNMMKARLTSKRVADALKDMGLLNENPNRFQKIFEDKLKGQGFNLALNGQMNYGILKGVKQTGSNALWILPPEVKMDRWINIPDRLLEKAAREGLEPVWSAEMKRYLMRYYQGTVRMDILYHHIQSAWAETGYLAYMGYFGYYIEQNAPEIYRQWKKQKELDQQFSQTKAPPKSEEKAKLTDPEKQQRWETWKQAHPSAAQDSTSADYKFMHQIIFGN